MTNPVTVAVARAQAISHLGQLGESYREAVRYLADMDGLVPDPFATVMALTEKPTATWPELVNRDGVLTPVPKSELPEPPSVRTFGPTGSAFRDSDTGKLAFEGFLSPLAIQFFAEYMDRHRSTPIGRRDADNWQQGDGIPLDSFMESLFRHFFALWCHHRGWPATESLDEALGGIQFNTQGYVHQTVRARLAATRTKTPEETP